MQTRVRRFFELLWFVSVAFMPLVTVQIVTVQIVTAQIVIAQIIPARSSDERLTLDLDSAVAKRLATVEDFVAEKQWEVVAGLLRQTQIEKPDKLILIAPGWFVSAARYCQCRAGVLPPAGLAAYRRQVDAVAKNWHDAAELAHRSRVGGETPYGYDSQITWRKILRQAFASSSGEIALSRLAEQAFESGDFAAARTWWEMLLPATGPLRTAAGIGLLRYPDATREAAQVRAHLILCSLFDGHVARAEEELAAFRRLHFDAVGHLAGEEGRLVNLLTTVARGHISIGQVRDVPKLEQRLWTATLPPPVWANADAGGAVVDQVDLFPVITDNVLCVTNGESIFAFDVATGRAKWSEAANRGSESQAAVIHSLADPIAPKWPISGRPQQTLTVCGERLYARLGTPVTGRAKQESQAHSEIVGLDIATREGKLVWRVAAEEVDPQDPLQAAAPWCFEGSPVADGRHVFVAMRRSLPQEQINVACFDADSARLLWNRKVGITVASTDETVNSTSHLRLTLVNESLFLSTDAGAIAALEADDGAIRWLRTYGSESSFTPRERRREGFTPPLFHAGVLYVAPLDSRLLLAIHAESGLRLWQREWPDPIQYLLGISGDTLIVSGRSLWGIDLATGEPTWPHRRIGNDDPEGSSFGKGVLIDDNIWWPNRDELLVVAATSGQIIRRIPLRESIGQTSGHLTAAGQFLMITQANRVTVLGPQRQ